MMATFEEALARLETIVDEMQGEQVPLDRALALFEEGIGHLRTATAELGRAEAAMKVLVERTEGVLEAVEMED
jgi:exodeoxyribonuclease VII small subunit